MQVRKGPMFRAVQGKDKVVQATVGQLDSLFIDVLKRLQHRRPELLATEIKIDDEFSVRRSLRRGATTEAQNRKIPAHVVEANNRWKKHVRSHGVLPSMSMLERYSDAKASMETIIM
ncbi:hypothetical protein ACA910_018467 [Epithemia clementina (nom. ined.)]